MATKSKARRMSVVDALKILGVNKTDSLEQAKARYRKLSSELHPDKSDLPPQESNRLMQEVNAAWSVLREVLKPAAQADEAKARAEQAKADKAEQDAAQAKADRYTVSGDGLSVRMQGTFKAAELVEILYCIGAEHMQNIGDAVKNSDAMVSFFRALSTGRKNKVHSVALLDSKNRIIRMEELADDSPDIRTLATQALLHGAVKMYMVVNTVDGSVPKSLNTAQKNKYDTLKTALEAIGVEFLDFIIIGHAGHYSVKESARIEKTS